MTNNLISNNMTDKEKILKAINTLAQHDKNFAENISKLAALCVKNKMVYNIAVQKLNSL
jgi:hypothetical protein